MLRILASGLTFALSFSLAIKSAGATPARGGSHDFDFNFGTWHTSIRRLVEDPSGRSRWADYSGTVTVRKALDGNADIEELEAAGTMGQLSFLNVRLFNADTGQWSLNAADGSAASLSQPMFGGFNNRSGTFYDQESIGGRVVLVRQMFFDITPSSYSFQQAISSDGGVTWKPNFVANLVRLSRAAASENGDPAADTSHDFDFNPGTWTTRITTFQRTKSGSTSSAKLLGTVKVAKIWNGRALLEEIKASNAAGGFEGLTLYLYDARTKQWSQTYTGKGDGTFERSMIGGFHNGVGTLVSFPSQQDGTMQLVREVWSNIHPTSHHFEIQYSDDGGATWKPAFVANLERSR